jgi:hypothetical protein
MSDVRVVLLAPRAIVYTRAHTRLPKIDLLKDEKRARVRQALTPKARHLFFSA